MGKHILPRKPGPTRRKRHLDEMLPADCPNATRASHCRIVLMVEAAALAALEDEPLFVHLMAGFLDGELANVA